MQQLNSTEFQRGMQEIISQWGERAYSPARVGIIYREVAQLKPEQWTMVVNDILSSFRYAPLPSDFREAAGPKLAQNRQAEKTEHANAYKSLLSSEQEGVVLRALIEGMEGNTEAASKVLRGLSDKRLNRFSCKECNDTGLIFARPKDEPRMGDIVFNCTCHKSAKNKNYQYFNADQRRHLVNNNDIFKSYAHKELA